MLLKDKADYFFVISLLVIGLGMFVYDYLAEDMNKYTGYFFVLFMACYGLFSVGVSMFCEVIDEKRKRRRTK